MKGNGWRVTAVTSIILITLLLVLIIRNQMVLENVAAIRMSQATEMNQTNIIQELVTLNRRVGNSVDLLINLINKIGEEHGQESVDIGYPPTTEQGLATLTTPPSDVPIPTGTSVVPILTGTVTYSDDGTPVEGGTVYLLEEDGGRILRSGVINEGTYEITDSDKTTRVDIPAGKYAVTITGSRLVGMHPVTNTAMYEQLVAQEYGDPQTSGIIVTIPHEGPFDIKVDRYRK